MKISKKLIVVILVVAVAAYLLWKRSKAKTGTGSVTELFAEDVTVSSGGSSAPARNKSNLEDCIAVGYGTDQYADSYAAEARKVYASATTPAKISNYTNKANSKGFTIAQMAVVDAAYNKMKAHPDSWAHKNYLNTVTQRMNEM